MVWKINNNCQIFIEKTDSIAGRQKEIIPHVSAYYVDKYTTISEKGVKTGSKAVWHSKSGAFGGIHALQISGDIIG
mgnify:CR=1 FL=1